MENILLGKKFNIGGLKHDMILDLYFSFLLSRLVFLSYTSTGSQLEQARIPEIQYNGGTTDGHIATKRQIAICRLQSHNVSLP